MLASDRESLSLFGPTRTGDGLSTGRKEKLGESALDNDSGVPTELIVPGSGLDNASNLQRNDTIKAYKKIHMLNDRNTYVVISFILKLLLRYFRYLSLV